MPSINWRCNGLAYVRFGRLSNGKICWNGSSGGKFESPILTPSLIPDFSHPLRITKAAKSSKPPVKSRDIRTLMSVSNVDGGDRRAEQPKPKKIVLIEIDDNGSD